MGCASSAPLVQAADLANKEKGTLSTARHEAINKIHDFGESVKEKVEAVVEDIEGKVHSLVGGGKEQAEKEEVKENVEKLEGVVEDLEEPIRSEDKEKNENTEIEEPEESENTRSTPEEATGGTLYLENTVVDILILKPHNEYVQSVRDEDTISNRTLLIRSAIDTEERVSPDGKDSKPASPDFSSGSGKHSAASTMVVAHSPDIWTRSSPDTLDHLEPPRSSGIRELQTIKREIEDSIPKISSPENDTSELDADASSVNDEIESEVTGNKEETNGEEVNNNSDIEQQDGGEKSPEMNSEDVDQSEAPKQSCQDETTEINEPIGTPVNEPEECQHNRTETLEDNSGPDDEIESKESDIKTTEETNEATVESNKESDPEPTLSNDNLSLEQNGEGKHEEKESHSSMDNRTESKNENIETEINEKSTPPPNINIEIIDEDESKKESNVIVETS